MSVVSLLNFYSGINFQFILFWSTRIHFEIATFVFDIRILTFLLLVLESYQTALT